MLQSCVCLTLLTNSWWCDAQVEAVADYRTWVSGVTPQHLAGAPSLAQVQADVAALLEGRTLVGHGLKKDLQVLLLSHPRKAIRDTARCDMAALGFGGRGVARPAAPHAGPHQRLQCALACMHAGAAV